ncbi:hypothetical protein [Holdemania filiformis]|uniref:hypothetical protein n=1 Tax=Holdemania filiformis TaxID=61171 RepID=UPI00242EF232|nr:hypothetical protein [Holdemania filiformis]
MKKFLRLLLSCSLLMTSFLTNVTADSIHKETDNDQEEVNVNPRSGDSNVKMDLFGSAARIRSSQAYTNTNILTTVPRNGELLVTDFTTKFDSQGYQWIKVSGNGDKGWADGYAQYDPAVMLPHGGATNLNMQITGCGGSRVRSSINTSNLNNVIKTYSVGQSYRFNYFRDGTEFDGFVWIVIDNNGSPAYAQYDPACMYPYSTEW